MARWQSGDAADCKSVYAGSIPTRASISQVFQMKRIPTFDPLVQTMSALSFNWIFES